MNEPTHRVASDESHKPQNQKNYAYGPKHVRLLSMKKVLFHVKNQKDVSSGTSLKDKASGGIIRDTSKPSIIF
jgi:hypothetical protein